MIYLIITFQIYIIDYFIKLTKLTIKFTIREISENVKRSKSVVGRIVKSYNDTVRIISPCKTGKPRKTSAREDKLMQRIALKNRFKSSADINPLMPTLIYTGK